MERIFLDYDASAAIKQAEELAASLGNADVFSLSQQQTELTAGATEEGIVRGVLVTQLSSGWLKYHSKMICDDHGISHWVIAVIRNQKQAVVEGMLRNTIASVAANADAFVELVFVYGSDWNDLHAILSKPPKSQKSCLVVSHSINTAQAVADVLQYYLPDWDVHAAGQESADFSREDAALVVGCTKEELMVAAPSPQTMRCAFWMDQPYFLIPRERQSLLTETVKALNSCGWNLGDYRGRFFTSSLIHETGLVRINREEILPVALKLECDLVLWDDYGLPLRQTMMEESEISSRLKELCVFPHIAEYFTASKQTK